MYDNIEHGAPVLDTTCENCTSVVAPLPASGHEPSEAECAEQIQTNKAFQPDMTRGTRFCVQTGEGRTAYLRVISAGIGKAPVRLKATVWELPD
ncbi:hypothetical protein [Streptomyces lavenduligriseus]|uniref:Uncharacterized protein n=1 Tax=Streptomyces lavenduligriseus TaxID=67315 RepID=A0ABT0P6Q3_9ACTN|nr:hypothetical protein [Streptomyces lavenduligriseus]MCL3999121.1 hypothetical protein [Streptomyces lavenduligriseus]